MDFTIIEIIYLAVAVILGGIVWMLTRDLKREQRWHKEDAATCRLDIRSWQDKFDGEHAARIEFASLNTELTLQRDTAAKSLKVFGDIYREWPVGTGQNLQGCICEMAGNGIKPLTDISFVSAGHYEMAAALTKHLAE